MMKSRTSIQTRNKGRVIAVDPGFDRIGVAVLDKIKGKEWVVFSTCIETNRKFSHEARLKEIGDSLREFIAEFTPSALAIEKLFFNQNITTGIKVAEARGVVLYEAARGGLEVFEYSPQQVKVAVTGYGKAAKPDLVRMVGRLVNFLPTTKHDDEADAVAVGITHLASQKRV